MNQTNITFKLIVVGDEGVGKTTFLTRHRSGVFLSNTQPTLGVECSPLSFSTNEGKITFNIWDCAGSFRGLEDGYYIGAQCALLFFDVTNEESYKSLSSWYRKIRVVCPDIPIVVCGNKVDRRDRKVSPKSINFHRKYKLPYFDVSAKSNYNFEKPFLFLLRKLRDDDSLEFVESEAVRPPQISPLPMTP